MKSFQEFVDLIKVLRAPGGCPWDREQTFQSLYPHIIEEAYELGDTLQTGDLLHMREELGDVLLHVVMLSNMAEEQGAFGVGDVISDISEKMVRRHPHVFGDATADSAEDVLQTWEDVKRLEKSDHDIFSQIPKALPALLEARKIQKKASKEGFDWDSEDGPWQKIEEELEELKQSASSGAADPDEEMEFGDVLFALVNYARFRKIDPEQALKKSNEKFKARYLEMKSICESDNVSFTSLNLEEKERLWSQAKVRLQG